MLLSFHVSIGLVLQEWGPSCPHEFLDAYRLEFDQSWTHVSRLQAKNDQNEVINKIISRQLAIADPANPLGLPAVTQGQRSVSSLTEMPDTQPQTT